MNRSFVLFLSSVCWLSQGFSLFRSSPIINTRYHSFSIMKSTTTNSKRKTVEGEDGGRGKRSKAVLVNHNDGNGNGNGSGDDCSLPFIPTGFQIARARLLTPSTTTTTTTTTTPSLPHKTRDGDGGGDCVVLWMFRDQRIHDNHAFHYAQLTAKAYNIPLYVIFNIIPGGFLGATLRQYDFMLRGLEEVERELHLLEIPFYLLIGDPIITIPDFVLKHKAMMIVNDFFPLRQHMEWSQTIATMLSPAAIPMIQVDAHNIVPCWVASPKLEYSARTFRSKITPKLAEYLTEIPPPQANPPGSLLKQQCEKIDWKNVLATLPGINREVLPITWLQPGRQGGEEIFQRFVNERLHNYGNGRNDPNNTLLSDLSPYLHFGQLSMQSLLLRLKAMKKQGSSVDSFVEEAVVRRELTDNFCFYNPHYDSLEGCYEWARETLNAHRHDPRPFLYSRREFEEGRTHDDLWNAAQIQMTREGKMHGFLRMYWAKKILEWSASPEEALSTAIYLNDKYELDGRDPSGYVGCMWSIGGIHDQGWAERAIFGKIRYMNYQGCERKFDVKKFVQRYPPAAANALALTKQSTLSFSSSANGKKQSKH